MVNIHKLAAVDIHLHGRVFVLIEFGGAVLLLGVPGFLHILRAFRSHSAAPLAYWYFAAVAVNYIPLLVHAAAIARKNSARTDIEADLAEGRNGLRSYPIQQFVAGGPSCGPHRCLSSGN